MSQNVLLVTVDSLRYDRFESLRRGGHTPRMDELDESGISFSSAFAAGPGTTPSFPPLLTGTYALKYDGLGPLSPKRPILAEFLQAEGFSTGGFQTNPFLSRHFNYQRGFDQFEDYQHPLMGIATRIFPRGVELNNPKLRKLDEVLHLTDVLKWTYQVVRGKPRPYVSAEVIVDDATDWIGKAKSPFFCWTHFMDVHHPCFPPREYRSQFGVESVTQSTVSDWYSSMTKNPDDLDTHDVEQLRCLYDAATAYVDDQIGRLVEHLKKTGRFEETLIVLTSDHGELFGEHGLYGKPARLLDELLHVPLIVVNGPDYLSKAANDLVSLIDIPPLIHDAIGLDIPKEYDGRRPGRDSPREYVIAEHEVGGDVIVGARTRDWLYEADDIESENRLFDLRGGNCVRVSIDDHPEGGNLREVVLGHLEGLDVEASSYEAAVEGDVRNRLEDLGYL